jgi:hypothetical protein
MKSILFTILSFFIYSTICFSQTIWPGDVNNNGIVNEVDLLYLGFAFDAAGSVRTNASSDWIAQEVLIPWEGSFPNGLSFAYADCNGDGIVDEEDIDIIALNFTNTHNDIPFVIDTILAADPDQDPKFSFLNDDLTVVSGGNIDLNISLGTGAIPVDNLLGLAFNIKVDPRFFQTTQTQFVFDPVSWTKPFGNLNKELILNNADRGKTTVAFTAIDGVSVSGSGLIGTASFVIIEDAVDLLMKEDTLKVAIDSIIMVTDELEKVPILGETVILELEGRITSNSDQAIFDGIKIYPNPTNDWVLLKAKKLEFTQIEVVNHLGQVLLQKKANGNRVEVLNLKQIPNGVYWLRALTNKGIKNSLIQKL